MGTACNNLDLLQATDVFFIAAALARMASLLAPGGRLVLSVSLERAEWLDMNGRRLPLYPDDPDRTASLLRAAGLVLTDAVPVEAALLLAAGKPQDT